MRHIFVPPRYLKITVQCQLTLRQALIRAQAASERSTEPLNPAEEKMKRRKKKLVLVCGVRWPCPLGVHVAGLITFHGVDV